MLAIAASAAACGGAPKDAPRAAGRSASCRATVEDAVALAVTDYVKQVKPKPERFLVAAGTDSSLGDAGLTALQDRGPTYLFPGDPALQATVRGQLHEKGDYTTLLVVRHGAEAARGAATVRLAGHFVGGEEDGRPAGARSYVFACDTAGWHLRNSSAEQSA